MIVDLSMAYAPGVARVCVAVHEDPAKSWALTMPALLAGAPAHRRTYAVARCALTASWS